MKVFSELSLILIITLIIASITKLLKQPLVISYIFSGLLVGPYFLGILHSVETIELFSKIGITALLFVVGLGLSPKVLKELGFVSLVTGLGQILFTATSGFIISNLLGFNLVESVYISLALTFSSTIIVLKLLTDKGDTNKLYSRVAVGFLLVQDFVATIVLVVIAGLTSVNSSNPIDISLNLLFLLGKGFLALVILFFITHKILNKLDNFVSKSQEFLFLASISWGLGIAALYYYLGLSIEIGALVAGVTLSMTPYAQEVTSRLKPLRDFFITLFFIFLGSNMVIENVHTFILPAIVFTLLILIGNPIIVFVLMNLLGFSRKVNFQAGLNIAQIGEFSLILATLGFTSGHISQEVLSLITLVGIMTIISSTYLILYSDFIYRQIGKYFGILEFKKIAFRKTKSQKVYDALIVGYKRAGPEYEKIMQQAGLRYLIVDFNPDTIDLLEEKNVPNEYGDASDLDFLLELPLKNLQILISTVSDFDTNVLLIRTLRKINIDAVFICMANTKDQALRLYDEGSTHVILSHWVGAKQASLMLSKLGFHHLNYERIKAKSIKSLTFD
jgi:Kef-type K+ transport system membrane component KefB